MLNQIMSYTYSDYGSSSDSSLLDLVFGSTVLMALLAIPIILSILTLIANWKIYSKMGEAGWKSIVPIYSTVVLFQRVNINPLFILVALIPLIGNTAFFIIQIIAWVRLCKGFGKDTGFTIGYILLSFIFWPILAFDKNTTWDTSRIDMNSCSFLNKDKNFSTTSAAPNMNTNPSQPTSGFNSQPVQPGQPTSGFNSQPVQPGQPTSGFNSQPVQPGQPTSGFNSQPVQPGQPTQPNAEASQPDQSTPNLF